MEINEVVKKGENIQIENIPSIWRNSQFLLLWIGNSISTLLFQIYIIGLPIMIYQLTNSSLAMTGMRAIETIPNILLGMAIGTLVDRVNRKKLLQTSVGFQIITIIGLIFLLSYSSIQLWQMYIVGFLLAMLNYVVGSAYHTILPQIVKKDQLTEANSSISFINTIINIAGPGIAGFIILYLTFTNGLLFTLFGLVVLLLFTLFLRIPQQDINIKKKKSFLEDMLDGWKQLLSQKDLFNLTIIVLLSNLAVTFSSAVFAFYALDVLMVSAIELGLMYAFVPAGGILASLIAKKSLKLASRGKLFVWSLALDAVALLILFLSNSWSGLSLGMFILGFSMVYSNIHYLTIRQESTPNHLLGRVAGTSSMIMKLAVPLSFISGGLIAEYYPVQYIFLMSSLVSLGLVMVGFKSRIINIK